MGFACPRALRRLLLLASMSVVTAVASCSVYEEGPTSDAGTGGRGGSSGGNAGASGSSDASTGGTTGGGGSTGGNGGSNAGAAGATGGTAGASAGGASGRSGAAGTSGSGGVGTGGSGPDGSAGAAGSTGTGGAAGSAGSAGAAGNGGTSGTSGAGGMDGGAGTGGVAGTAGAAGSAGTSGTVGTGGTGGSAGTAGTAGTGGTADAAPDLPPPGAVFAVGSFTKSTATGSQVVTHTLGQSPKALLLWTSGKTNETASPSFSFGLGLSDASTSMSMAMEAANAVSPSLSGRRMAAKAITLVNAALATLAEADISARSASSFTLNWTTNNASAYVIHYLAIGGPQVAAKVVTWQTPTAPGNKPVTGVGFQPEVVLHMNAGAAFLTGPPSVLANAVFGLGAMDRSGGQWSLMVGDTANLSPSATSRAQKTDSTLFTITDVPLAISKEATFVSMDSGGFTVNFTANSSSPNASQIVSLALAGLRAKAGSFSKSVGAQPASQPIATPGFRPGAVLFSSYQAPAQTAAAGVAHARLGIGASDGLQQGCSAMAAADNASPTNVDGIDKTSKAFMKIDNTSMTIEAEADLMSFDATGFTLSWTRNDTAATQIPFLALGAP